MTSPGKYKRLKKVLFFVTVILALGFLIPQSFEMPVDHATRNSYSQKSFWYYPWSKSLTHKGVDIFAKKRTSVQSATNGIVLFEGQIKRGGNVVLILGPKWRLHYYAHLDSIHINMLSVVTTETKIGTV